MGKTYLNIYLGLLLCVVFGIFIPSFLTSGEINFMLFLFYIISFYSSFRLALIVWSRRLRLLESIFYIFTYVFLGVGPLSQVYNKTFPWRGSYDNQVIVLAGFTILLGLFSYGLGIILSNSNDTPVKKFKNRSINLNLIVFLGFLCFFIGIQGYGGFMSLFLPRNDLTAILGPDISSNLLSGSLVKVPIFIASLFCLVVWKNRPYKSWKLKSNISLLVLLILTIGLTLLSSNPISASRNWFGTVLLSYLLILLKWKKNTLTLIIFSVLFLLLIVFPYADIFRNEVTFNFQFESLSTHLTQNGDYDAFQMIMNIQRYTKTFGYSFGKQLLGALLFFIPRFVWPGKPIGTGATAAEAMGYGFTNVSAPLWAEFYVNFGIIGVVFLFTLYGWISGNLQNKFICSQKQKVTNFYTIFVPVFSVFQLVVLRGDLMSSMANLAPIILFILLGLSTRRLLKGRYKPGV